MDDLDECGRKSHARPVLVAIDGGPATVDMLRGAARIAASGGHSLLVANVAPRLTALLPEAALLQAEVRADLAAALFADLVEALFDAPVPCRLLTTTGSVARQLAALAREHNVATVVVGTESTSPKRLLRRLTGGSLVDRLTSLQPAPVIVLPTRPACCPDTVPVHELAPRGASGA